MTTTDLAIEDHTPDVDVETPQERAERRLLELRRRASGVMSTLADIYRDNDWQHLKDRLGRPYTTFTAFIVGQLGGSESGARRYQQGIIGLIMPLQELTDPGTEIPVLSSDVAKLGKDGARTVVERAPAALEGQSDQTFAIRRLIDTVLATGDATELIEEADQRETEPAAGDLVPNKPSSGDDEEQDGNHPGAAKPEPDDDEEDGERGPRGRDSEQFKRTLDALLATNPEALASQVRADSQMATDCVHGAQLLARISQLIR